MEPPNGGKSYGRGGTTNIISMFASLPTLWQAEMPIYSSEKLGTI